MIQKKVLLFKVLLYVEFKVLKKNQKKKAIINVYIFWIQKFLSLNQTRKSLLYYQLILIKLLLQKEEVLSQLVKQKDEKIKVGDEVEIVGYKRKVKKTKITGVEMFNKYLEYAQAGDDWVTFKRDRKK